MKLRATIVVEWDVDDLSHYNATTIEEAAKYQQRNYNEGGCGVEDLLMFGEIASVVIQPKPRCECVGFSYDPDCKFHVMCL